MKLNRKLVLIVSLVLSLALATGGTLAYLQDTDADVNVMTLGNVHIEQHEYERVVNADGTYVTDTIDNQTSYVLQEFTQGKPLLPIVGDPNEPGDSPAYAGYDSTPVRMSQVHSYGGMQVFAGKNAQDKFVTVENTGKSDAYIRTIVAIEVGSTDGSLIKTSYHQTWKPTYIGTFEIDGNNYMVFEYTYKGGELSDGSWRHKDGLLPAGDTSYPNLCQVYLKHQATNEDVEAIDGNGNGMLDILVLSQAIQAAGFADAETALNTGFGEVNEENVQKWFGDVTPVQTAATADELVAALANGGTVVLTADITMDTDVSITIADGSSATLDLAGYTLSGSSKTTGKNRSLFTVKGELTVKGGTVTMTHTGDDMGWNNLVAAFSVEGGELTLDGVTVNASGSSMTYGVDVNTTLGETVLHINGGTEITSSYTAVRIFNNHKTATGTVNLNAGTLTGTSRDIWVHNPSATAVDANGIVNINNDADYTVTVQDTFNNSRIYQID